MTYRYQREITNFDPNPLINTAGFIGYIPATPPDDDTIIEDSTINALIISNSQLNVVKDATPTATILGNEIVYDIFITNIGDDTVYDIIVWDDRYNLEYADDGYNSLIPDVPDNPNFQPSETTNNGLPGLAGTDALNRQDLEGQLVSNQNRTVAITYRLPVPPDLCALDSRPECSIRCGKQCSNP